MPVELVFHDDYPVTTTRKRKKELKQTSLNLRSIFPKTTNQKTAFVKENQGYNLLLFGQAGTGKSFLSLYFALKTILEKNSTYKKIVIVRSVVQSRNTGFLPGSIHEKSRIFEAPYYAICSNLFGRDDAYEILKTRNYIDFQTTSFLRGLTFDDCIVVFDEFQNCNEVEIFTVMTRLGENSRIFICGDTRQNDLISKREQSGAHFMIDAVKRMPSFFSLQFTTDDIIRSKLVKEWLLAVDDVECTNHSKPQLLIE